MVCLIWSDNNKIHINRILINNITLYTTFSIFPSSSISINTWKVTLINTSHHLWYMSVSKYDNTNILRIRTVKILNVRLVINKLSFQTSYDSLFDRCCNICTINYHTIMPEFLSKQTIIHFHLYVSIGIVIRENVINRISLSEIIYICSNNLVIKIIINIYNTI